MLIEKLIRDKYIYEALMSGALYAPIATAVKRIELARIRGIPYDYSSLMRGMQADGHHGWM